jgi:hypothetical protein
MYPQKKVFETLQQSSSVCDSAKIYFTSKFNYLLFLQLFLLLESSSSSSSLDGTFDYSFPW